MTGADIGLGWVDQAGQVHFQVYTNSYLFYLFINTVSSMLIFLFTGSICLYVRTANDR